MLAKTRFVIDPYENGLYATEEEELVYNSRERIANVIRQIIHFKNNGQVEIVEDLPLKKKTKVGGKGSPIYDLQPLSKKDSKLSGKQLLSSYDDNDSG